ncbi:MAG TPA: NUDIX domain-containing protein [Candidatus Nanoarchaeia archaeon]|nr:NUDIX domain-containing protein [Candidatus Nanoarchaeia archaeon]
MDWKKFDRGVFLVNLMGIIYDSKTKRILIGKRENDPYINKLSWTFVGGRPSYKEDLEFYLKHEVKIKTGLDIEIKKVIFAKTYPEKREFLSIYYLCEVVGGKEKAGEKFVELKWVKPTDVKKYFTTSLHQNLLKYLKTLE